MQLDPTNTTANDLIFAALKEGGMLGPGQTPGAEDLSDGQARLQWMLQQWRVERWLVYHLVTYSVVSTGVRSYTVGPGGQINTNVSEPYGIQGLSILAPGAGYAVGDTVTLTMTPQPPIGQGSITPILTVSEVGVGGAVTAFNMTVPGAIASPLPVLFAQAMTSGVGLGLTLNTPIFEKVAPRIINTGGSARPDRLESAFLRQLVQSQPNEIDYPLEILESMEDYNQIALKGLQSFPGSIFYDSAWPLASVYAWPVPQANIYSLNLTMKEQLPVSFPTAATKINLPYEYYYAIISNLALRLRPKYGIVSMPGDLLPGLAKAALNVLRGANTQIGRLQIPNDLNRRGIYNIFSDRSY